MRATALVISKDPKVKDLKKSLEAEGHKVFEASDVERGLDMINRERPDLLYLDIRDFPYEEILIKGREIHADIEYVLITSLAEEKNIMKKAEFDIYNFLIPPLTPAQIRLVTNRALRQTELAKKNRHLMALIATAKAEWEATVDAIEDPIFIIGFDHRIKRANLALFRRLGKGVSEIIGQKCHEVLRDLSEDQACELCAKVRESGESASVECDLKNLGGRYQIIGYPLVFSGGGGFVICLREKK